MNCLELSGKAPPRRSGERGQDMPHRAQDVGSQGGLEEQGVQGTAGYHGQAGEEKPALNW